MATTVIMVRHGFSLANEQKRFAGHWDIPLTDLGKRQAQVAAEYLKAYPVTAIWSSDLMRAYQTAEPIAAALGLPIHKDPGLREIKAGKWEGAAFEELPILFPEAFGLWMTDLGNSACPEGESVRELSERVLATVFRLAEGHDGQTVCLTTHATPIRAVCTHALGRPVEEMAKVPWVSNASISIFRYENGGITPVALDCTDHLGDLSTKLPANV